MALALPLQSEIAELDWADFWPKFRDSYRATRDDAQHVAILGPNGTGKTTLAMQIASVRPYVFVLAAKPRDRHMLAMLRRGGYRKVEQLPESGAGVRRCYLWPPNVGVQSRARQRQQFAAALAKAFRVGVWHGLIDEGHYLAETLKLAPEIKQALQMGRSNGHGIILAAQRPAWLPRDVYSASTHLFLFGTNDAADLKSISGLNGVNDRIVRDCVATLGRDHRFLHVNTATGELTISRFEKGR
jgi:hypothetical protein